MHDLTSPSGFSENEGSSPSPVKHEISSSLHQLSVNGSSPQQCCSGIHGEVTVMHKSPSEVQGVIIGPATSGHHIAGFVMLLLFLTTHLSQANPAGSAAISSMSYVAMADGVVPDAATVGLKIPGAPFTVTHAVSPASLSKPVHHFSSESSPQHPTVSIGLPHPIFFANMLFSYSVKDIPQSGVPPKRLQPTANAVPSGEHAESAGKFLGSSCAVA